MFDQRTLLPIGTILTGHNGVRYTITEGTVGRGGSCLLYPAVREGSGRLFVVKECFPLSSQFEFIRRNWIVSAKDGDHPAAEYLNAQKADLSAEDKVGQLIATRTGRTIAPWETLTVRELTICGESFDASGSAFTVMEQATGPLSEHPGRGWFFRDLLDECRRPRQEGFPLRCGGLPSPYLTVRIMEELLKSLRDIHRAGYIHGDVHDGNFFFMGPDPETGDIGVGQLLDFGNARPLEADGFTQSITDRRIFSTFGYWPPEILTRNNGSLRLSPAADIYSAGCMLLYLLKGMSFRDCWGSDFTLCSHISSPLSWRRAEQRGFRRDGAALLITIVDRALAQEPGDRYPNAGEMLKDILTLKKLVQPPRFHLPTNLSRSPYFVEGSRDREIKRLQKELDAGKHPLWIWGIWGIGKTELAMEFARRQIARGMDAHLLSFRGTIKDTILHMDFSGYQFQHDGKTDAAEQEYREKLSILKENYEGSLLIIDHFEQEGKDITQLQQEPAYRELVGLNLHLLFTSRSRPDKATPELSPLQEADALTLYESITKVHPKDREDVLALLREVRCHPLVVELSAHAVENDWEQGNITPKKLLSLFRNGHAGAPGSMFRSREEASIYSHIRELFTVLDLDDSFREVLCHTTLLPQEGMDAGLFLSCEQGSKKKQLKILENHGWVRRNRDNLLQIHPLVRTVFKHELAPSDRECNGFLSCLWEQIEGQFPPDNDTFRQSAELFSRAAFDLENKTGNYSEYACHCLFSTGHTAQALLSAKETLEIRTGASPHSEVALARACHNVGTISLSLFGGTDALPYSMEALQIMEGQPPCGELAEIYITLGMIFTDLGEWEQAVKYGRTALELAGSVPSKNKALLPSAHNALALALAGTKAYEEAVHHMDTAIELSQTLMPGDHPLLARLYCTAGNVYGLAGNFPGGLALLEKALKIQEAVLPREHSDLIASYMTLAELHALLGDRGKAARYRAKSSDMLQTQNRRMWAQILTQSMRILALSENSTSRESLAQRYRAVAEAHRQLRNYADARTYIRRAIQALSDGTTDPMQQVLNYATASDIQYDELDYEGALRYAMQAFRTITRHFPEDHDNISTYALKVGVIYRQMRKTEDALSFYQAVIDRQMQRSHPDQAMIQLSKTAMGSLLAEQGRHEDARAKLREVLDARACVLPDFHADVRSVRTLLDYVNRLTSETTAEK